MQKHIKQADKKVEEQPKSAEHDFYESLASTPQAYEDQYEMFSDESEPYMLPSWAVIALVLTGFLVVIALLVAIGVG